MLSNEYNFCYVEIFPRFLKLILCLFFLSWSLFTALFLIIFSFILLFDSRFILIFSVNDLFLFSVFWSLFNLFSWDFFHWSNFTCSSPFISFSNNSLKSLFDNLFHCLFLFLLLGLGVIKNLSRALNL